MDKGNGNFNDISAELFTKQMQTAKPMVFQRGETIEIRGSRFRVEKVHRNKLILKLLLQK